MKNLKWTSLLAAAIALGVAAPALPHHSHAMYDHSKPANVTETRQALANLGEVLKTAGTSFQDVTSVTVYITSFDDFAAFNAVYREFFPDNPPARATVQVAALNAGARVELQMVAVTS